MLPANTISIIYADLGGRTAERWATTIWGLGSCIGFLLVGRLSDMFERKWMVQGTSLLSLVGCIVGATATRFKAIVGANLCNGLASAGLLYHFFYHLPTFDQLHVRGRTKWQMVKGLDLVGIVLFVAGCVLFVIGLS